MKKQKVIINIKDRSNNIKMEHKQILVIAQTDEKYEIYSNITDEEEIIKLIYPFMEYMNDRITE